jgi:hypothetical protein
MHPSPLTSKRFSPELHVLAWHHKTRILFMTWLIPPHTFWQTLACQTWFDVTFTCILDPITGVKSSSKLTFEAESILLTNPDPHTGHKSILVAEHDISPLKQSEWLLKEQQKRNDNLLYTMLPRHVVAALKVSFYFADSFRTQYDGF